MVRLGSLLLAIGVIGNGTAAAQAPVAQINTCAGQNPSGFTIRDARVEDPFWFLRWRRLEDPVRAAVAGLKGQPYSFDAVNAVSKQLEDASKLPDDSNAPVAVEYSDIGLTNCRDRQLDVVFRLFSASASPTLSTTFEWGAKDTPAHQTAGVARTGAPWQLSPELGFDAARGLYAGGQVRSAWPGAHVLSRATATAVGSRHSRLTSLALEGGHESTASWFRMANWRMVLDDSWLPAGLEGGQDASLTKQSLSAQFSAASRPTRGIVVRLGGLLNGGRLDSSIDASALPSGLLSTSRFTSATLLAGATGRRRHQAFSASYALALGSSGRAFHGDWRKHVGDLAHELWLPVGDHRLFELEQRFTVGELQGVGAVPVTERFYAGAYNPRLTPGDEWRIPAGPVIRSIPTNQWALDGLGASRFAAYNATVALTIWRKPVLPAALRDEPALKQNVASALTSAGAVLETAYRSGDPAFRQVRTALPGVLAALKRVQSASAAARDAHVLPDAAFADCDDSTAAAATATEKAIAGKPPAAHGWVEEMLPDGDSSLAAVLTACGGELVSALRSAGFSTNDLDSATAAVRVPATDIARLFASIDSVRWAAKAKGDLAYARRALDVILDQLNLTSVSPVFIFDAARLGLGDNAPSGKRYAVGGGVRLSLISTVNFTMSYAANPRRLPGEKPGALVFAVTTRNLLE